MGKSRKKIRTLYDCSILLSSIRYKLGIDKIKKDPEVLLNHESIIKLSNILESGFENRCEIKKEISNKNTGFIKQTIREGKSTFRNELISHYGLKCMITGVKTSISIEAAHIIPYNGRSTNNIKMACYLE